MSKKLRCFLKKFTQLTKILHDRRSRRSRQIPSLSNVSDTGCIDGEFVESIMCNIPNISNRNILRTLTILRRKLPKKHFQANLKKVIQQRTNLLEDLFETNPEDVSDGEGNIIKMPVTNTKDLNTFIHVVCEKRGVDPENIKLMLGVGGGQGKLAIVPNNEKLRTCQRAQVSSVACS